MVLVTAAAVWSHCLTTFRMVDELLVGRLVMFPGVMFWIPAAHLVTVICFWTPGSNW